MKYLKFHDFRFLNPFFLDFFKCEEEAVIYFSENITSISVRRLQMNEINRMKEKKDRELNVDFTFCILNTMRRKEHKLARHNGISLIFLLGIVWIHSKFTQLNSLKILFDRLWYFGFFYGSSTKARNHRGGWRDVNEILFCQRFLRNFY